MAIIIILGLIIGPIAAYSGEYPKGAVTYSRDVEKMKELVGVWEGKADMGKGMETIKATYELTQAGNAIIERLFVGQPNEMVTVYYDFKGKLSMTLHCSLGNQPHMELMNPGENTMMLVLSKENPNLASVNETHMHSLTISFDSKDSIIQTWTLYEKGKEKVRCRDQIGPPQSMTGSLIKAAAARARTLIGEGFSKNQKVY